MGTTCCGLKSIPKVFPVPHLEMGNDRERHPVP